MAYRLQDTDSILDWEFDWSEWVAEGDSIQSHQWSVSPMNGTSPDTPTLANPTQAGVIVSGLQAGKIYHLTDHITTVGGVEADQTIVLRCDPT